MQDISSHYQTLCKYLNFRVQGMILGFGCGTVDMTEKSSYPQKAYEFGGALELGKNEKHLNFNKDYC